MGQIVPDAVERYLAGLNRAGDAVLDDIARDGAETESAARRRRSRRAAAGAGACDRRARASWRSARAIGYSGIWLAGALPPGGMLLTMEKDPERARDRARQLRARRALPIASASSSATRK